MVGARHDLDAHTDRSRRQPEGVPGALHDQPGNDGQCELVGPVCGTTRRRQRKGQAEHAAYVLDLPTGAAGHAGARAAATEHRG